MSKNLTSIEQLIQQEVLNGGSDNIRKLLLTPAQVRLVHAIETVDYITTYFVIGLLGVSSANASAKLKRLYEAGYLKRSTREAETGGLEYIYRRRDFKS